MSPGAPRDERATVAGLLSLSAMSGAAVLAGNSGTKRSVAWVARLGEPGDALTIGAGDLVLVDAVGAMARGGPRFISRLADKGVAGIALRSSSCRPSLPEYIKREAEDASFPIVALPPAIAYRELSLSIASLVFGSPGAPESAAAADHGRGDGERSAIGLLKAISRGDYKGLERACLGPGMRRERDWPELRTAIESYLKHGGNAIAAAAELGVHRHTVRARVRRYETLSGLALDDPDSRLAVALAFRFAAKDIGSMEDGSDA